MKVKTVSHAAWMLHRIPRRKKIMVVQHNLTAMNSNRQLGITTNAQAKSSEKLSSGYRINRAGDDAAGLTISEKMRSQIRGLNKASDNAQDGVSLIQVAEGALNETHSILQRMNELATQAANDTNTTADRNAIQSEINQLTSEINRIQSTTQFNTMNLIDGSFSSKNLQVGALSGQMITLNISNMDATSLFGGSLKTSITIGDAKTATTAYISKLNVGSFSAAGTAMDAIQSAITKVSQQRSDLGAVQNRLEHTIANLDNISENTQSAESRIRDTDMAEEMVEYSKNNILAQAGQSMLAQANQATQGVLSLLQ
jgi:flagellin